MVANIKRKPTMPTLGMTKEERNIWLAKKYPSERFKHLSELDEENLPKPKKSKRVLKADKVKEIRTNWVDIKGTDIPDLVERAEDVIDNMFSGEKDFLVSICEWLESHSGLTLKQYNAFIDLVERVEERRLKRIRSGG